MEIKHDKDQQKFYTIRDGKESYIRYSMPDKETINFLRTFVPPEQRHKGLAGEIAKATLEYAKENNLKVIPTCSYVDHFIDQNKEYEKLLA
ncbi:MAG: GNAT family N-acetyltransferase [Ignavibacteria bacterium]|nr:GNAT family N-acetyltransferase [Ignavibacteria bacterium]